MADLYFLCFAPNICIDHIPYFVDFSPAFIEKLFQHNKPIYTFVKKNLSYAATFSEIGIILSNLII